MINTLCIILDSNDFDDYYNVIINSGKYESRYLYIKDTQSVVADNFRKLKFTVLGIDSADQILIWSETSLVSLMVISDNELIRRMYEDRYGYRRTNIRLIYDFGRTSFISLNGSNLER